PSMIQAANGSRAGARLVTPRKNRFPASMALRCGTRNNDRSLTGRIAGRRLHFMNIRTIAQKPWLPQDCAKAVHKIEQSLAAVNGLDAIEARLMSLVEDHERHLDRESIGLNAGTNIMNPRAAALLSRSLGNRPSLGYPGDKYEMGMEYAEE